MRSARASIVKRGKDCWRVFVELSRDPKTGKRRRRTATVRGSRRDAEDMRVRLLSLADDPTSDMTLSAYVEAVYMPRLEDTGKPRTALTAADRLRLYVLPTLGDVPLCDITPRRLRSWLAAIEGQAKKRSAFVTLRAVLNRAVKDELLDSSPLAKLDTPARNAYQPEVLDAAQAAAYLEHFTGSPVEAAVVLAIGGGFRRGEIAALDWEDIDLATGRVRVDDAIVQHGRTVITGSPKSQNSTRTIHLPAFALSRLSGLCGGSGAVLMQDGERMLPDRITFLYRRTLRTLPAGVPRVPLKNLRHTSLTLAYDAGADLLSVSRRAGHASTAITSEYYVRPKGERDREAAEKIDNAIMLETGDIVCQLQRLAEGFKVVERF